MLNDTRSAHPGNNRSITRYLINSYFRKRRYAGSSDRRAINNYTYNVLRHIRRLDWWIKRIDAQLEVGPRAHIITELALGDKLSPYSIRLMFNGFKHCPLPLTINEENLVKELSGNLINHPEMNTSVFLEYPDWMDSYFQALWPERLEIEMLALNRPAPVDVRVNTLKTTVEAARLSLINDSIMCEPTKISPVGLRLTSKARLAETKAFKMGWIEVQDEGSQIVALLTDAKPSMSVVDLCAGAGGKTLAIAATMDLNSLTSGCLTACDISSTRLDRLKPRIKRAGIKNISTQILTTHDDDWIATNAGTIDRVLADVPCTGTGTWRRNPVSRWQLSIENLKNKIATQREILVIASKLVKKGGRLIYATCSLLKEENEHQLAWFIKHHNNFRTLPINAVWSQSIGGEAPAGSSLRLSPGKNGTDGFFCTILEKFK
jgi:16S rRNA (cytosine967-C5)-methyltransferase